MSNPRVDINLEGLERFIAELKSISSDLRDRRSKVNSHLQTLSQNWRDDEARKFTEDFHQFQKMIDRGISDIESNYMPFLQRKLQRARDFINQR